MSDRSRERLRACLACHEACLRAPSYLQATAAAVPLVRLLFNTTDVVKITGLLPSAGFWRRARHTDQTPRWHMMFRTMPFGSRTKNRLTPHASSVSG